MCYKKSNNKKQTGGRLKMIVKQIEHMEQECEGNYNFSITSMEVKCTRNFKNVFGDETEDITLKSINSINKKYKNPDYLQIFKYKGIKYYCISDFEKGYSASDYSVPYLYVLFLLPEDY